MPFDSASQELCDLLATRLGRKSGAGEGNRTLVASLEGWSFTTKLHPQNGWASWATELALSIPH